MEEIQSPVVQAINPWMGQTGHFLVLLALVGAAWSAVCYWLSVREKDLTSSLEWRRMARWGFLTHAASIAGMVLVLFFMIFGHHFEYQYVWQHSSRDLPMKYILSCFWEGQEGSFLLWSFWVMVLGLVLMRRSGEWEGRTMSILSLQQVFLLSFLTGVYVFGKKIGSSPFLLLEDALTQDPVFLFSDYMQFIQDGTGLNALLQNYWMVIHPPVLFLGFASITVPFVYAMAGLWSGRYKDWIAPAIPYSLFSGMVLGTGILMGGAWAYEALSFGGFWAWDPVENASLIPWLVIVAALHTMLVSKSTGHALRANFILVSLSFFFVLYASFLTRSGILGDTSVHSFVVSGLENHLLLYLFVFTFISCWLIIRHWKKIPAEKKEEATASREFWMFIGSLVLLFSALHVIFFTSIPAFNHLFAWINRIIGTAIKTDFTAPVDPVHYYTNVQIWVAIIIAVLTAFGQFLRYRQSDMKKFWRSLIISFGLTIPVTIFSARALEYPLFLRSGNIPLPDPWVLLLFMSTFTVLANLQYFITVMKGRVRVSGGSVSHVGFGILLLGILISNASQQVISKNTMGINYGDSFDQEFKRDNILLYKDSPVVMGQYLVTYAGDSTDNRKTFYKVRYEKVDGKTGEVSSSFILYPYLLTDKKSQQLNPNPDTKHYLTHDVFTHVSSIPARNQPAQDVIEKDHTIHMGDTIWLSKTALVLDRINMYQTGDTIAAGAQFRELNGNESAVVEPQFLIYGSQTGTLPAELVYAGGTIVFQMIQPETDTFIFQTREQNVPQDWIIMKAIVFPMINLVWLGMIVLAIGFAISMRKRLEDLRRRKG